MRSQTSWRTTSLFLLAAVALSATATASASGAGNQALTNRSTIGSSRAVSGIRGAGLGDVSGSGLDVKRRLEGVLRECMIMSAWNRGS